MHFRVLLILYTLLLALVSDTLFIPTKVTFTHTPSCIVLTSHTESSPCPLIFPNYPARLI